MLSASGASGFPGKHSESWNAREFWNRGAGGGGP